MSEIVAAKEDPKKKAARLKRFRAEQKKKAVRGPRFVVAGRPACCLVCAPARPWDPPRVAASVPARLRGAARAP